MSYKKRHFQYCDGKSRKFWEIQLDGASHTIRFGRIGTDGQMKTKEFASAAKARQSCDKLIQQKTAKGYREISARVLKKIAKSAGRPGNAAPVGSKRILLKSIYTVAVSLGADTTSPRNLPKRLANAPRFIAEFHCNFVWPDRVCFDAPESGKVMYGPGPGMADYYLSLIELSGNVQRMPEDFDVPGTDQMEIYAIGIEGGGNSVLVLDGHDTNPKNPKVYELDHELESEPLEVCDLLQFLSLLIPSK